MSDNTETVVQVTIKKKHKWYRFDRRLTDFVRNLDFSKPYRKRFGWHMAVYFAFFVQGLLGLITLTIFSRNLTAKPSGYLAAQRSYCANETRRKKEAAAAKKAGEEYVDATPAFTSKDDELDDFMDRFSKKKVYDKRGYLVKED